jgi:hypothetical protein
MMVVLVQLLMLEPMRVLNLDQTVILAVELILISNLELELLILVSILKVEKLIKKA